MVANACCNHDLRSEGAQDNGGGGVHTTITQIER